MGRFNPQVGKEFPGRWSENQFACMACFQEWKCNRNHPWEEFCEGPSDPKQKDVEKAATARMIERDPRRDDLPPKSVFGEDTFKWAIQEKYPIFNNSEWGVMKKSKYEESGVTENLTIPATAHQKAETVVVLKSKKSRKLVIVRECATTKTMDLMPHYVLPDQPGEVFLAECVDSEKNLGMTEGKKRTLKSEKLVDETLAVAAQCKDKNAANRQSEPEWKDGDELIAGTDDHSAAAAPPMSQGSGRFAATQQTQAKARDASRKLTPGARSSRASSAASALGSAATRAGSPTVTRKVSSSATFWGSPTKKAKSRTGSKVSSRTSSAPRSAQKPFRQGSKAPNVDVGPEVGQISSLVRITVSNAPEMGEEEEEAAGPEDGGIMSEENWFWDFREHIKGNLARTDVNKVRLQSSSTFGF